MHFRFKTIDDSVDRIHGRRHAHVDSLRDINATVMPLPLDEFRIAKISEGWIIDLDDVDPCFSEGTGLSRENAGDIIHEIIGCGIKSLGETRIPKAGGNEKWTGEGKRGPKFA